MTGITRRMLNKIRDELHLGLKEPLGAINQRLDLLHDTQLAMAENQHHQMSVYQELKNKVDNSGMMFLSDSEMVTKIFSGIKMYLDPNDIAVVPHLALDGIWEEPITKAWLSVVKQTDTIFDIGANFGYYGALAAQRTDKKRSKVVFFEANPNLLPYIHKTLSANWLNEQSIVENLAVADKDGSLVLHVLKDYIGSSSLHSLAELDSYMHSKMHVEAETRVKVTAMTVDSYCKQHAIKTVDLIKMDIEGFEDKAYQGMRSVVQSSPNLTLFIEFTKDGYEDPKAFYEQMLDDFGNVYTINKQGELLLETNTTYDKVIGSPDDWVMPVFSKSANLHKASKK